MPSVRQILLEHAVWALPLIDTRLLTVAVVEARSREADAWSALNDILKFNRAGFVRDTVISAEPGLEFEEVVSTIKLYIGPFRLGFRLIVMTNGLNWSTGASGELKAEDRD